MMASSESTEQALLKWVNTFPLESEIKSLVDLSDGLVFARMLEDISVEYAVSDAVKSTIPSKWLRRKKALEAVYRSLLRFLQNNTQYNPNVLEEPIDLDAIAEHDDIQQIIRLATLLLVAAVLSGESNSNKYSMRMGNFDQTTIVKIQQIVSHQVATQSRAKSPAAAVEDKYVPSGPPKDFDLALEEDNARLKVELNELKKKHADFITRFDRLDYSHEELKARNSETEEALEKFRGSQDDDQAKLIIQNLQRQLQESNDLIASQEQQLNTIESTKRQESNELSSLRADSKRLVVLDDEVRELKNENALLARKANRADHFEKKIESLVSTQKDNEKLKETNEILMANMKEWDQVHAELAKLQNSVERYQKMHANQELDIVELERRIKIYQQETTKQKEDIEMLRSQKDNEERFYAEKIEELTVGHHASPESPTAVAALTLEQELEHDGEPVPNYMFDIQRLKAENQLLKSTTAGATNASLRTELEEAEKARKQLEQRHRKITEDHAIIQQQLKAVIGDSISDKDQVIDNTRKLHLEANNGLTAAKSQLAQLQIEVAAKDRELLSAKTDLAAIDRDAIAQLNELKAVNELVTSSLENDLLALQDKYKAATNELEQKNSHLVETILANNKLLNDNTTLKSNQGPIEDDETGKFKALLATEEENKIKKDLDLLKEQNEKKESTIADLQRRLKTAEEASPDAQKAANESTIKNLTRENGLISTAWYDLTSRLQSNHVVLQRRQDAPKSWLNKQRQMVNATPRR